MKIGPYTISRGAILPYEEEVNTRQVRQEADDGAITVIDDWDYQLIKVKIVVPRAEALNIRGFLRSGVRYAQVPFTLEDDYGTSLTVRLWDRRIKMRTTRSNQVEMIMLMRQEVS